VDCKTVFQESCPTATVSLAKANPDLFRNPVNRHHIVAQKLFFILGLCEKGIEGIAGIKNTLRFCVGLDYGNALDSSHFHEGPHPVKRILRVAGDNVPDHDVLHRDCVGVPVTVTDMFYDIRFAHHADHSAGRITNDK
jgi:hypothetical protein